MIQELAPAHPKNILDLEQLSFAEWLIDLNAYARRSGYRGRPLVKITAMLAWSVDYDAGLTPAAALLQAAADGIAFGQDYCDTTTEDCCAATELFVT
jgi:hypothetical protein